MDQEFNAQEACRLSKQNNRTSENTANHLKHCLTLIKAACLTGDYCVIVSAPCVKHVDLGIVEQRLSAMGYRVTASHNKGSLVIAWLPLIITKEEQRWWTKNY